MALWFFKVSSSIGPSSPPDGLAASLKQGTFYAAAAWEAAPEGFNLYLLSKAKSQDPKVVRADFQKKCSPQHGALGKRLPHLDSKGFVSRPCDLESFQFMMSGIRNLVWLREVSETLAAPILPMLRRHACRQPGVHVEHPGLTSSTSTTTPTKTNYVNENTPPF